MKFKRLLSVLLSVILLVSCFTGIGVASVATEDGESLTVIGASIRISGVQGLRFVGEISKENVLITGEDANFGFILIPQTMIGKNEKITVETAGVRAVPAKKLLTETEEYCQFSAVLTEIPAEFYGSDIVARVYFRQGEAYTYSTQISRSIKTVAELILSAEKPTDQELSVARQVMAAYEAVGTDILVNAEDIWNLKVKTPTVVEDFSLAPNEFYLKVENEQPIIGVFNQSIDLAVNSANAFWKEHKSELEEGYFQKSNFVIKPVSYTELTASDPKILVYGGTDKNALLYTTDDEITFRFSCYSGETLVSVPYIKYEIYNEATGMTSRGYVDASSGTATVTVSATGKVGAVYVDASACDASKNKITENITTIDGYHFRGSAIVDSQSITMSVETPSDFDNFWNTQKTALYSSPIEIIEMVEKQSGKSGFKLFYVELKCNVYSGETDGIVSGYLTYPISASSSSKINLRVAFKGYSFSASSPSYNAGAATFSVCAHSIDCELAISDSSYLSEQEKKNTIFDKTANSNRETAYFRGMIMRDLQAARFMMEYFGEKGIGDGKGKGFWNGTNFIASGGSQGAFQAIAVAALDENITYLNVSIPWMCDVKAANGRRKSDFIMDYTSALEYYDTTSFAHLITCKTRVSFSLGDATAPVSGVIAFYNALTCEKTLVASQNASHSAWLQPTEYELREASQH
ncbi:MAG: acetylxylan esterase [Clostridia bacterium]|nr:acetylxylan esterase [Clostridia bacterium]